MSYIEWQQLSLKGTTRNQLAHPHCMILAQDQDLWKNTSWWETAMLKERKNGSSDPASRVYYKSLLKQWFISGHIAGMAKKLLLFHFLNLFSPLKTLVNSWNSHVPMSSSEIMQVALLHRKPTILTLSWTTKTIAVCHICQMGKEINKQTVQHL